MRVERRFTKKESGLDEEWSAACTTFLPSDLIERREEVTSFDSSRQPPSKTPQEIREAKKTQWEDPLIPGGSTQWSY